MDITSRIIAHNRKKMNEAYRKENLREDDSKDIQKQTVNKRRSEDPDYPMKTLQKDRKDELTPGTSDVNEDHMDDCNCAKCKSMNESMKKEQTVVHKHLLDMGYKKTKNVPKHLQLLHNSGYTHHYTRKDNGNTVSTAPNGSWIQHDKDGNLINKGRLETK